MDINGIHDADFRCFPRTIILERTVRLRSDGKTMQNLRCECLVFKVPLEEVKWEVDNSSKCVNFTKVASFVIKKYAKTAVILTQLYRIAVVAGASVTNECSFSALQRIDAPTGEE